MEQSEAADRLSRIETQWTAIIRAHGQSLDGARSARDGLLVRYSGAVYRYLLGAVRDPTHLAVKARRNPLAQPIASFGRGIGAGEAARDEAELGRLGPY